MITFAWIDFVVGRIKRKVASKSRVIARTRVWLAIGMPLVGYASTFFPLEMIGVLMWLSIQSHVIIHYPLTGSNESADWCAPANCQRRWWLSNQHAKCVWHDSASDATACAPPNPCLTLDRYTVLFNFVICMRTRQGLWLTELDNKEVVPHLFSTWTLLWNLFDKRIRIFHLGRSELWDCDLFHSRQCPR